VLEYWYKCKKYSLNVLKRNIGRILNQNMDLKCLIFFYNNLKWNIIKILKRKNLNNHSILFCEYWKKKIKISCEKRYK